MEGELNGKWGQNEFTKFRILGSSLGLQDIGKKYSTHLFLPHSGSRVTPAHTGQLAAVDHSTASHGRGKWVNKMWMTHTVRIWILTEATPM